MITNRIWMIICGTLAAVVCAAGFAALLISADIALAAAEPQTSTMTQFQAPSAVCGDNPASNIGGTIFLDYDVNGARGAHEPGYGQTGMLVHAFADNGMTAAMTATVETDGSYFFAGLGSGGAAYRLEFSGFPSFLEQSTVGSVQFVSGATCSADLALLPPDEYCGTTPEMAVACYVGGDVRDAGDQWQAGSIDVLVSFAYTASGKIVSPTFSAPSHLATGSEVGTIWGLAWDRYDEKLYTAAFLKRHSGLLGTSHDRVGTIYQTDPNTSPVSNTVFLDLIAAGYDVGQSLIITRAELPSYPSNPSADPVYDQIAKVGLGDIDISADGNTLYAMNLYSRSLMVIDTAAVTVTQVLPIPDQGCNLGQTRPFATKVYRGDVYVGVVCSAEDGGSSADLTADVLRLTPSNTFTSILTTPVPLDYIREQSSGGILPSDWQPWSNVFQSITPSGSNEVILPQPILSDIEFDVDGSLILGFMDRNGHQTGNNNVDPSDNGNYSGVGAGDVLRLCAVNGQYILEGNTGCAANNNFIQPGTTLPGSEFYGGDTQSENGAPHRETTIGGLAILYGSGDVVSTVYNPYTFSSGGILWLDNTDGDADKRYELYDVGNDNFAKAHGLGDLELLCPVAPLFVGDRIWIDSDGDGVQDAAESGLGGVAVTLTCGGVTVTTTTTISDNVATPTNEIGQYNFSNLTNAPALTSGSVCTVSVSMSQTALTGYTLTTPDAGGDNSNARFSDLRDSDATLVGGTHAAVSFTAGSAGQSNHTFDIGVFAPSTDVLLGNRLWFESDSDGDATTNFVQAVTGVVVEAFDGTTTVSTTADAAGLYTLTVPANGTYTVSVQYPANIAPSGVLLPNGTNPSANNNRSHDPNGTTVVMTTTNNLSIDFGFTALAAIGDYVWYDSDADGVQDAAEVGIANVQMGLYDASCSTLLATQYTNANGGYLFGNLAPGSYCVQVIDNLSVLTGLSATSGLQVHNGSAITVASGETFVAADFGYVRPTGGNAVIGDTVWYDTNSNGQQDPGEVGIAGVGITVTNGISTWTTTTDDLGRYYVTVPPGTYTVQVRVDTLPAGLTQTYDYDEALDHLTANIVVAAGDQFLDADFGYTSASLGRIGNLVWHDVNNNGVYESGSESGFAGVTVDLVHDADASGTWTTGDRFIASQTTDENGAYLFDGLPADDYLVYVSDVNRQLLGYTFATLGTAATNNHNQAQPYAVTLSGGSMENLTADFGYVVLTTFGGPVGVIGNQIWFDDDVDGIYEPTQELGIAGVVVELLQGTVQVMTTTTNSEGRYLFAGLPVGSYTVRVIDTANVLQDMTLSVYGPSPGSDGQHQTQPYFVTLGLGEQNMTADFGYIAPREVTSIVFNRPMADTPVANIAAVSLILAVLLTSTLWMQQRSKS